MKIGQIHSQLDEVICSSAALENPLSLTGWVTQVRDRVACPMLGEWQGVIPDAEGLCARSVTSCARPDQMQYQVYNCNNQQVVYTLTKRIDLHKQECFVGIPSNDGKHKIME